MAKANVATTKKDEMSKQFKGLLSKDYIKNRFEEILGDKTSSAAFISSILSVYNGSPKLQSCDPMTILGAAINAAMLKLPISPTLGKAYIVPYGNQATFQLGYKGYIELAQRTKQYLRIETHRVYEGEIRSVNRFTGDYEFGERTGDEVIGYLAYIRMTNGFEKYHYMSKREMIKHAIDYARYKEGSDKWGLADFDVMAEKTVLKKLLSVYGFLSVESCWDMDRALSTDGAVVTAPESANGDLGIIFNGETLDAEAEVVLNANSEDFVIDGSTGEVLEEEPKKEKALHELTEKDQPPLFEEPGF